MPTSTFFWNGGSNIKYFMHKQEIIVKAASIDIHGKHGQLIKALFAVIYCCLGLLAK
jgi:hypothetical protein